MPKHSFRAPWGRRLTASLAVSLLTLGACSSNDSDLGPSSIEVVEIVTLPNNQSLTNLIPAQTRQLLGVPTNSKGNFIDKAVTWATSNAAAVSVSTTGEITAVAGGSSYIRATAGGQTDSILVSVRYPVGTITLAPATPTLRREATQQLTATVKDTQGATVTGRTITWSSNNAGVTVSSSGLVAVGATTADATAATITATAANAQDGGVSRNGTATVTVSGNAVVATVTITSGTGTNAIGFRGNTGSNSTLVATAKSGLGNTITTPITWSSNNPAVATVDASTGVATFGGGIGAVVISANATASGNAGADIIGTAAFEVAQNLVSGTLVTAPDLAAGSGYSFAFDPVGNGFTGFGAVTSGGSGDGDMYVFAPGVTNWTTTDNGGSGFLCRSWNSGNGETCTIATAAAGWYRVRLYSWTPAGAVSGMNLTVTGTP